MTKNKFRGTGVAIVTPFRKDDSIDFKAFAKVINYMIDNKVEYIVALGTTGESATISEDERHAVIDFAAETIDGRVPLVVGIGGNNTQEVIHKFKKTDLSGADAVLTVCPYYNKPSQRGIYEHYKAVSHASPLPVMMYNVPGRTGMNISAETTLKIAHDLKNIIATKEACGNLQQIMDIIRNKPKNFLVISGDDMLTLPIVACGGDGVISVAANACPREFSDLVRMALDHKLPEAQKLQFKLFDIMNELFADGSPGGAKAALHARGMISNYLRLPLVPVNDTVYKKIEQLIKNL